MSMWSQLIIRVSPWSIHHWQKKTKPDCKYSSRNSYNRF